MKFIVTKNTPIVRCTEKKLSDVNEKIVLLNDKVKSASDEDELLLSWNLKGNVY
jgi:hypothetical protein